jgi:HSP20 family molecular chaperone IbpA
MSLKLFGDFDNRFSSDLYSFGFFDQFEREMNRKFNRMLPYTDNLFEESKLEMADNFKTQEDQEKYVYEIKIPGCTKEDILIKEKNGVIIISTKKDKKEEEKRDGYYSFNSSYESFRQVFKLPKNIDCEKIKAKYSNEILILTVPKKETIVITDKQVNIE